MQLYKLRKKKRKKLTLQAMFLTKTWMSSECKIFFSQNIICFSRTPPIVQPMQKKKKKNIESYPLKTAIGLPCCFERPIIMVNMC